VIESIATATKTTVAKIDHETPPRSPKAVLSVSREEFYGQDLEHEPLELIVKKGLTDRTCKLPEDLQGHVFIVGAAGSIDSPKYPGSSSVVEPYKSGWTPLYNGDGMVYRLDFHKTPSYPYIPNPGQPCQLREETGKAWMATRLVKTPDYYADLALHQNPKYREKWPKEYPWLLYRNFGFPRVSFKLGIRNYLNTALLPMRFSDGTERLLVTWDAGRPYEIDPCTLGVIAPIGWNWQWHPLTPLVPKGICPPTLSTAHPQFDSNTDEMFTVNVCKSFPSILPLSRIFHFYIQKIAKHRISKKTIKEAVQYFSLFVKQIIIFFEGLIEFFGIAGKDAVYLNRWTGQATNLQQWKVLNTKGRPIKNRQSLHQMALTQNYVILSDSGFKIEFAGLLPFFSFKSLILEKYIERFFAFIRNTISLPQLSYTDIYFISRNQLDPDRNTVTANQVRIYPETAHFLVDYEEIDGKVTLYVGHTAASDPAEFIHRMDRSISQNNQINYSLRERAGVTASPMDASRLGRWIVDVKKEIYSSPRFLSECDSMNYLWALSIYTGQEFQYREISDLFWNCWGAWPELLSQSIFEMYEDYPHRMVSASEMIDEIFKKGKPANLLRLHIDRSATSDSPELTIEDSYNFPRGYFGNSPQFVPRPDYTEPTDGYIVCVVIHSDNLLSDNTELWIFDAQNLSAGPQYRLSHPRLNMGVTIHTTWLSKLETPPIRQDYSVREDYEHVVAKTRSEAIKTLFEEDVYPHFES
jgi:carotenoid cleavage dioxygenase-like enzyme